MILLAYAVGSWPQFGCTVDLEDIGARRVRSQISPLLLLCEMIVFFRAEMIDRLRAWFLLGAFARLIRSIEVRRNRWENMDARTWQIKLLREARKQSSRLPERIVNFTEPLKRNLDILLRPPRAILRYCSPV